MYYSMDEAARRLRTTKGTLSKWCKKGLLYAIESLDGNSHRRCVFFDAGDVEFLAKVLREMPTDKRRNPYLWREYRRRILNVGQRGKGSP